MDLLRREFFVSNDRWVAVPLGADDAPALQDFLDANPLYSQIVNGRPFRSGEALEEITDVPPFAHRQAHAVALLDRTSGAWLGFVSLVDGLIDPGVCHIGLFLVGSAWHGTGLATEVYTALEQRARTSGARWMRLGVVVGNVRAERFWRRMGFEEVRQRHGQPYEGPSTSVRVLFKPLGAAGRSEYLACVERDRPDSP